MHYVRERTEELKLDGLTDEWEARWVYLVWPGPVGPEELDLQKHPADQV